MIDKIIAEQFSGMIVKVTTIDNFFFRGLLKTVTDNGVLIDDYKDGLKFIAFLDIRKLESWERKNGGRER